MPPPSSNRMSSDHAGGGPRSNTNRQRSRRTGDLGTASSSINSPKILTGITDVNRANIVPGSTAARQPDQVRYSTTTSTSQQTPHQAPSRNPRSDGSSNSTTRPSWASTLTSYVPQALLAPRTHAARTAIANTANNLTAWLPATLPSLTSLADALAPAPQPISTRDYVTAIEPFHPVDHPAGTTADSPSSTGSPVSAPPSGTRANSYARSPSRSYHRHDDNTTYFLVHDASDVAADETYDPRLWAHRPAPLPATALDAVARRVVAVGGEVAAVGGVVLSAGAAVVSVGTADGVGDLVRGVRGRWVEGDVRRDAAVIDVGEESDVESDEESDQKDDESMIESDEEKEVESDEESDDDEEILIEGLRIADGEDHDSSDDEDAFFDAQEQSATADDGAITNIPRRSSSIHNHQDPLVTTDLADIDLSSPSSSHHADFDLITANEASRIYDLSDVSPHTRRALRAHQHHPRRPAQAMMRAATATATATLYGPRPSTHRAASDEPATTFARRLPGIGPLAPRPSADAVPAAHHRPMRPLARAPSPGSSRIAMVSERVDELPRRAGGR